MASRGVSRNARHPPRGPAAARHLKKDHDGDLAMGMAIKGKGGISKSSSTKNAGTKNTRLGGKRGVLSTNAQREILKHAGDVQMREPSKQLRGLVELKIGGWAKSKASTNADGGVSSLISWIEKKASNKLSSRVRTVKVKKSRLEGEDLFISVPAEDMGAVLRLNGWVWAGTNVTISKVGDDSSEPSTQTSQLKDMIKGVLERRYNMEEKMLDLSALGQDPELQAKAVFNQKSTTSKFFPAMMKVLTEAFDTPKDKDEAIISVSLANNELSDLSFVTTLSQTLPKLRNLDLSNNKFATSDSLSLWKKRFFHLSHLVISGNPIEQNEPDYVKTISNWYPKLRMLNNIQVRTEDEVNNKSKVVDLPFPIRSPSFQDEGGIAENFIRTFFAGFDNDRNTLAGLYYDEASTFSVAINTAAPRDPAAPESTEKQEWDQYIKHSRNLRRITQLPARANRIYKGPAAIAEVFSHLPRSRHPDLAAEAKKWMIETHIQPGVPDGQSATGVDGFMTTIHGEFDEIDPVTSQPKKKRSFDRTFIIGPGGSSGVRIVSDLLTVRAYGGIQAFEPEHDTSTHDQAPQLPNGLTIELAEQLVVELQTRTRMTLAYAKDCLEQVGWDLNAAQQAFESVKASLPADAFVPA